MLLKRLRTVQSMHCGGCKIQPRMAIRQPTRISPIAFLSSSHTPTLAIDTGVLVKESSCKCTTPMPFHSRLCAACDQVGDGQLHLRDHHQSFEAFEGARLLGCSLCTRLWARLDAELKLTPTRDVGIRIAYQFTGHSDSEGEEYLRLVFLIWIHGSKFYISFDLLRDSTELYDRTFASRLVNDFPGESNENIGYRVPGNTNSESTVSLVKHWLSDCQANHPGCTPNADAQQHLPMRVIDVGKIGDASVRLHVSDRSVSYSRYITLSHCWGDADFMKLTTENEMSLRAGFAVEDLPKTFRDAIQFTRALSVKYLWVDSLCILQDSLKDWRHQSSLMGDIYRNCFCNLAATSSSNSHGGLFVERDPNLIQPLNLTITRRWLRNRPEVARRYHIWDSKLWRTHVQSSPLNRRGWVLQERLLAPRVVHFSNYIFWECESLVACDATPPGRSAGFPIGRESFYTRFLQVIDQASAQGNVDGKTNHKQAARSIWWDLVHAYSRCMLSKDEDILVAISGIANILETTLNDQCVAGLWKRSLLEDLLWNSVTAVRQFPLRAPSWSWASMKGEILHSGMFLGGVDGEDLVEIKDMQLKTFRDARNGQVETGYLTFEGLIFELSCKGDHFVQNVSSCKFDVGVELDDRNALGSPRNEKQYTKFLGMPITIQIVPKMISLHGLVIEPAPGGYHEGYFVRIGTFFFVLPMKDDQAAIKDIQLELKQQKKRIIVLA